MNVCRLSVVSTKLLIGVQLNKIVEKFIESIGPNFPIFLPINLSSIAVSKELNTRVTCVIVKKCNAAFLTLCQLSYTIQYYQTKQDSLMEMLIFMNIHTKFKILVKLNKIWQ